MRPEDESLRTALRVGTDVRRLQHRERPLTGHGAGMGNLCDNCPTTANADQVDRDSDRVGDPCDQGEDLDGDGVLNFTDNWPTEANPNQNDSNGDGRGNACDNEST